MSRIPNPPTRSTPSSPTKPSARTTLRATAGSTTPTLRTRTISTVNSRVRPPASPVPPLRKKASTKSLNSPSKATSRRSPVEEPPPVPKAPALSIKEQIALRRAEALKAKTSQPSSSTALASDGLDDEIPEAPTQQDLDLGRWSVKETIERARSSGVLNIASRALPCLPSALFEIHLGITPEPLKLVTVEPSITTGESSNPRRKATSQNAPSWFEAQDLGVLKAWSNEIVEIQPEIHMFGSLKTIDLHNNKLASIPDTFADLTALVFLDLSHNQLNSLPTNIWALPNVTTLNLSHNALTALPFSSPFTLSNSKPVSRTRDPRGDWFGQEVTRATQPLPRLTILDVSHNPLTASSIDHSHNDQEDGLWLPNGLTKLDLSSNPLGNSASLLRALSRLRSLREIKAELAEIGNESFPVNLLSANSSPPPFAELRVLDLGETRVTKPVVEAALRADVINKTLDWDITDEAPSTGVLRVMVGKKIIKEAWEIEAERRAAMRLNKGRNTNLESSFGDSPFGSLPMKAPVAKAHQPAKQEAAKEAWEVEAEQGLFTEGAKRRARAQAAAAAQNSSSAGASTSQTRAPVPQKEIWEIEAEQGLLTAGGRRRARAAAMAANLSASTERAPPVQSASPSPTTDITPSVSTSSALCNPLCYNSATQTLTLPPSNPPTSAKNAFGHARSFSLAPSKSVSSALGDSSSSDLSLAIPTPTLPLVAIASQSFAAKLSCLVLNNRRMDPCFNLLAEESIVLPLLEELSFENCNLGDTVSVSRSQEANAPRTNESLIPLLTRLFPSLRMLDLSYNHLTSKALGGDVLSDLILTRTDIDPPRKGLRHLRLRGNKLVDIDGFISVSGLFKGHKDSRDVESWKLEELDVRDNEIGRLPPELGLLPLDVLLVDGNVFRVPARRVWEREGTKGLLGWLRGRIE
ncbi:hypothetical protein QCA50_014354 [Cerrena zonata]|uniref:L domain-like protein n=1 Tax=Cerrena zonata TaxID=2478898 RepID=A0AAW0FWH9_9APHY